MKTSLSILLLLALAVTVCFTDPAHSAETDVEFVFDVSGSMLKKLNGEAQIDIARKELMKALKNIPSDQMVAMRVFAHRVPQTNKAESCKDTELLIPFGKPDAGSFSLALAGLTPKGYTPIAYSLEKAAEDMIEAGKSREPKRVMILLSDGEETCDGNAVQVLKRLREQGFEVIVHTIGFNVDDIAKKQLQDIAAFSGGKFYDAKDGEKLGSALEEATKESYVIEKKKEEFLPGTPIRGGDGFTSAVEFKKEWQDVVFRLDHHQKRNNYDYFYVDVATPTHVSIEIQNLEKKIELQSNGKYIEKDGAVPAHIYVNSSAYAPITYVSTAHTKLERAIKKLSFNPGKYYFRIGSYDGGGSDLHKDGASYKIKLETLGDLGSEVDAGSSMLTALPIEAGKKYELNHLGGHDINFDEVDYYKLEVKNGEKYSFLYNSLLTSDWDSVGIRVTDAFNVQVKSEQRGNGTGGAPMLGTFTAKEDGFYYLALSITNYSPYRVSPYSFEVKKEGGTTATPGVLPIENEGKP